jgi:hypothetical protein
MLKSFHQSIKFLCTAVLSSKLFEPFAKEHVQSLMTGLRDEASAVNQVLVSAERNVPHTVEGYTRTVHTAKVHKRWRDFPMNWGIEGWGDRDVSAGNGPAVARERSLLYLSLDYSAQTQVAVEVASNLLRWAPVAVRSRY